MSSRGLICLGAALLLFALVAALLLSACNSWQNTYGYHALVVNGERRNRA